jgi:uncharacterized membrane protein YeaQ/YmgE (transglycosylase-associated protein family)
MEYLTQEIKALLASGVCGTLVRTIFRPEKNWKAWLLQMFIGLTAAVFLGQLVAHLIVKITGVESSAMVHYAVGYIIGTEAERFIRLWQDKLAAKKEEGGV